VILAFALVVAVLFGAGAYLLLQRDLIRAVAGVALISQSAVVTLLGAGLTRGPAPISVKPGDPVSDPLPQALALTALVIGLATVAFLLALVHRVVVVYRTAERDRLSEQEAVYEAELARLRAADTDEAA
jgi:multicomponent Na+:H+ antiporter subunit C